MNNGFGTEIQILNCFDQSIRKHGAKGWAFKYATITSQNLWWHYCWRLLHACIVKNEWYRPWPLSLVKTVKTGKAGEEWSKSIGLRYIYMLILSITLTLSKPPCNNDLWNRVPLLKVNYPPLIKCWCSSVICVRKAVLIITPIICNGCAITIKCADLICRFVQS